MTAKTTYNQKVVRLRPIFTRPKTVVTSDSASQCVFLLIVTDSWHSDGNWPLHADSNKY